MIANTLGLHGRFYITLYGPDGGIKAKREGDNVITTVGKEFLASFMQSATAAASTFTCRYVAIGTTDTAESASDTGLGTETARVSATASYVSGAIYQLTASFGAGVGTGAITEYGVFSTSTGGTCFSRDIEDVVNKGAGDTLISTWQLTLS